MAIWAKAWDEEVERVELSSDLVAASALSVRMSQCRGVGLPILQHFTHPGVHGRDQASSQFLKRFSSCVFEVSFAVRNC